MPKGVLTPEVRERAEKAKKTAKTMEHRFGKVNIWRKFVQQYLLTGNAAEAVRRIYGDIYGKPAVKASLLLARPEVQALVQEMMAAEGATPDKAARIIAQACDATKEKGDKKVPDHIVRLRASDMILRVWDGYAAQEQQPPTVREGDKHLHIYLAEPLAVREFIVDHQRMPSEEERKQLEASNG